jgi:hypothetical protein
VVVVATPSEDDTEDTETIVVERSWEDQMQYLLLVSGQLACLVLTNSLKISQDEATL